MNADGLAVNGGTPFLLERKWAQWPVFAEDEISAVSDVLRSGNVNYWTGSIVKNFETEYAAELGRKYGIALANGTLALELALYAIGIGPGDEVIVPARTFIASASCIVMRGARPVVVEVDPISGNLSPETVAPMITPRTKAIIVVHLAGWPCEMDGLMALAERHGIKLVEDCAQAHGARYRDQPVGSFGIASAFSFCQDKIMSTGGEGGLLVLDDEILWRKAWAYKDHGKDFTAMAAPSSGKTFRWVHESFGTNWRMTETQAAIGRLQLKKLDAWHLERKRNAEFLAQGFSCIPGIRAPIPDSHLEHAYYKYYAFINTVELKPGWDQAKIIDAINAEGVPCSSGSCTEIYRELAFVRAGLAPAKPYPVASEMGLTSLMFQVHPGLTINDMRNTVAIVRKVMAVAAA